MSDTVKCWECQYWQRIPLKSKYNGFCRAAPPQIIDADFAGIDDLAFDFSTEKIVDVLRKMSVWPVTKDTDWCGSAVRMK